MKKAFLFILIILSVNSYSKNKDTLDLKKTELEIQKLERELKVSNSVNSLILRDSLELIKMKLEIKKMESDADIFDPQTVLKFIASLVGIAALLWTILSGFKTLRSQILAQRENKITSILEMITSDSNKKRAAGSLIISKFINQNIDECLGVLAIEDDYKVKNNIYNSLLQVNDKTLHKFIETNNKSLIALAELVSYLEKEGKNEKEIQEKLKLEKLLYLFIKKHFRIFIEHVKGKSLEDVGSQLESNLKRTNNLIDISSEIISQKLLKGRKTKKIELIILTSPYWYRKEIAKHEFDKVNLNHVLARHGRFTKIKFYSCLLDYSNFINSKFISSELKDCFSFTSKFIDTEFNGSKIISSKFEKCDFSNTSFYKSTISNSNFVNCILNGIIVPRASNILTDKISKLQDKISKTIIKGNKFIGCKLIGATINNSALHNIQFNGGELTHAAFVDCKFRTVEFNGVSLKHVKFTNCTFIDCDFNGNDLQSLVLEKVTIENSGFYKCKNIEEICNGKEEVLQLTKANKAWRVISIIEHLLQYKNSIN